MRSMKTYKVDKQSFCVVQGNTEKINVQVKDEISARNQAAFSLACRWAAQW